MVRPFSAAVLVGLVLAGALARGQELFDLSPDPVRRAADRSALKAQQPARAAVAVAAPDHEPAAADAAAPCTDDCLPDCDCRPCLACNLCPQTYAFVEGLLLERDNQARRRELVLDADTLDSVFDSRDLDFDWDGGLRVVVGYRPCGWRRAIEFGYLGVFDQGATARLVGEDSFQLPDDLGVQVNNFNFADEVRVRYESDLHSFELNFPLCSLCENCDGTGRETSWFFGFRYVSLDETASLTADDSDEGDVSTYRVRTDNDLFGGQLGLRLRRCYGRFSWEATGKAGLFGTTADQSQDAIEDFLDPEFRPALSGSRDRVSFLGEVNLTGLYQLNDVWSLRLGYNLIWIEGVALAVDQFEFSNDDPEDGTRVRNGGGLFLHGVSGGLEARW